MVLQCNSIHIFVYKPQTVLSSLCQLCEKSERFMKAFENVLHTIFCYGKLANV